jgi:hypothetical protein
VPRAGARAPRGRLGAGRGAARRLGDLARFTLAVEDVLDDRPAEAEGDARITSGITYRPRPSLDAPWARAVLDALRAEG